jgi:peptidoglycan/LPS O-acetylase OafA/YrhL
VSVFFTLSGFLITSLALVEHERTGRLDVGGFYARRVRRLLPASLACIVGVIVLAGTGVLGDVTNLRRDVWAALGQVYNWVALAGGDSYAELVTGDRERLAPLDHYWSLAIEEQFYWVWPLVLVGVLRLTRRGRALVLGALTVAAGLAAPLIARTWGADAAYWATPARLGELLVGAATALAVHERRATGRRLPARTAALAPIGLVVVGWAAVTWPAASGPAYDGWLPVFALASAAVIVGLQVDGPLRRLLARRPLVALGAISYGVYLYHWPVFAVLDEQRLGLDRVPLFAVRLAVTIALAALSAALLEQPVRRRQWTIRPVSRWAVAGCVVLAGAVVLIPASDSAYWAGSDEQRAAVALAAVDSVAPLEAGEPAATAPSSASTVLTPAVPDLAAGAGAAAGRGAATPVPPPALIAPSTSTSDAPAPARAGSSGAPPSTAPAVEPTVPAAPAVADDDAAADAVPTLPATMSRPARILVVGDSTASAMGEGLVQWAGAHPAHAQVTIRWAPGCGFIRTGIEEFEHAPYRAACDDIRRNLAADLAALQPDVVVLMVTIADTEARTLEPGAALVRPGDAPFDEVIAVEYERFLVELLANGVQHVAWVVPPTPDTDDHELAPNLADPLRWSTLRRTIEQLGATHPSVLTVIDLEAWEAARPRSGRPDGLHFSAAAASELAATYLAPTLIDLALR